MTENKPESTSPLADELAAAEQADREARDARHPGEIPEPDGPTAPREQAPEAPDAAALKAFATGEWDDADLDKRNLLSADLRAAGGGSFVRDYEAGTEDVRAALRVEARTVLGISEDD